MIKKQNKSLNKSYFVIALCWEKTVWCCFVLSSSFMDQTLGTNTTNYKVHPVLHAEIRASALLSITQKQGFALDPTVLFMVLSVVLKQL